MKNVIIKFGNRLNGVEIKFEKEFSTFLEAELFCLDFNGKDLSKASNGYFQLATCL